MKTSLKTAAFTFAISIFLYACDSDASRKNNDAVLSAAKDSTAVKSDPIMQGATSVTSTTTSTNITVDPATNDSTIVTTTVIKHSRK